MVRLRRSVKPGICLVSFYLVSVFVTLLILYIPNSTAITIAVGKPYRGRLINGIPFPRQFTGYQLRSVSRTYATPELIGGLLDAIDGFRRSYPGTCDIYLGDFSHKGGGRFRGHKSHQNGRDVDIGMLAKGNRQLNGFIPMNRANLDAAKTWSLIVNLLKTGRVQYIFLDRRLQPILYRYAVSHGWSSVTLDRLFYNVGRRYPHAIIRHVRGHRNHMHVRFYAPWSSLAARITKRDRAKLATIAMAQEAYLPKKVRYYVKGNEPGIRELARDFGVDYRDLCRWNKIKGSERLRPGTCLVFYKRSFELEPVSLAQSLQAPQPSMHKLIQLASYQPRNLVDDLQQPVLSRKRAVYYRVKPGDNLWKIARKHRMSVKKLCRLNHISSKTLLKPGRKLKVGYTILRAPRARSGHTRGSCYLVKSGDSLWTIARKNGTSVSRICRLNHISTHAKLKPGQTLVLPARARTAVPRAGIRRQAAVKATTAPKTYKVRKGDSLWSIARRFGVSTEALCRRNRLPAKAVLHPGQVIRLLPATTVRTRSRRTTSYIVRSGDTLWDISKRCKTSLKTLCALNNISPKTTLKPGVRLKLP